MAQWGDMTQILQYLSHDTVNNLYHPTTFPIEMRHYIAGWIENQKWEDFTMENLELESQAQALLDTTVGMLEVVAEQTHNVVDKMKLMQSSRNMGIFQSQPLQFAVMVRDTLNKERALINERRCSSFQTSRNTNTQDVDHLVLKVREVQNIRKDMHLVQQDLNWLRQNYENLQGSYQPNGLDASNTEIQTLQKQIQQLESKLNTLAMQRFHLLKECVDSLEHSQSQLIGSLKTWRWEQHKSIIGLPFDENLVPLQIWCEQLLGINGNLRQELLLIGEHISDLQDRLKHLLQTLIESSFVVDKQPPQVIKTQSKFTTTVRYLLGEKVAPGKPVMLTAQIINELQAKNLASLTGKENVAELINNTAILEHNAASRSTCATFRSLSIKKIKRADRKGTESVTEEKFALLFSAEITITGCDTPYKIQMISQPLVIIVHGCQDNNALATIIWDAAFCEADRVPFVVPERVPWRMMCNTLNSKFTSEVQTQHNLDQYNQHFLAQKIFNKPDFTEDFSNMMVSWSQFNKEVLPGRTFTFWQWFEGVIDLTKRKLEPYWSENLIFGFIGKQHLHLVLKDKPNGTFMLRFSDSEIGGITIAYVSDSENGGQKIKNIQPFTKKDLEIRSLGDRIKDISEITYLYPNYHKLAVFKKFFSEPQAPSVGGYIPVSLHAKVGMDAMPPAPSMQPVPESSHGANSIPRDIPQSVNPLTESPHSNFFVDSPVAASAIGSLDNTHTDFSVDIFPQPFSPQDLAEDILKDANSSPNYGEQISPADLQMDIDTFLGILPPCDK